LTGYCMHWLKSSGMLINILLGVCTSRVLALTGRRCKT